MYVSCLHIFMWTMFMQCPWRLEENPGSPGAGLAGACELPCGCWYLNLVPLLEQHVVLNPEPSLQALCSHFSQSTEQYWPSKENPLSSRKLPPSRGSSAFWWRVRLTAAALCVVGPHSLNWGFLILAMGV